MSPRSRSIRSACPVGLLARDGGEVQPPQRLGHCPQPPMVWEKLPVDGHFALFARADGAGR
ncbi:MAG TPA: hypothetical protein VFU94_13590 [Conexibacter sp.]|nr:hypothetical protein [Conexibacter sp.]